MQSTISQQQMEDFFRYARFVCEHFDIEIELDSTKAETDGRVIRLPSVAGLSSRELDMMYAILLHEAGHIKYSIFTEESFQKLKTQAHAQLANAIEDARIENLLMKDFDGAKAIFESLYGEYVLDKNLMRKLFKINPNEKPSLFHSLGTFIHCMLLQCDSAPIEKQIGVYRTRKIRRFLNENHLLPLIDSSKIKTWDDVVALTNKIYDCLVQQYKDKSEKLDFKKDAQQKTQAQNILEKLSQEIKKQQEVASQLSETIEHKYTDLDNFEQKNKDILEPLREAVEAFSEQKEVLQKEIDIRKSIERCQKQKIDGQQQLQKNQETRKSLEEDLQKMKDKMAQGLNGHGKPMTDSQKENLQARIDSKESQLKKNEQKANSIKNYQQELDKQEKSFEKDLRPSLSNKNNETLEKDINDLKELINHKQDAIDSIMAQVEHLQKEISNLEQKLANLEAQVAQKVLDSMMKIDQTVSDQFGVQLLPEFVETPGWDSADNAQKEFDEQATKETGSMVRNGGKMAGLIGSNLRDLQLLVDLSKEKVADINLQEIFKEKINLSKLPKNSSVVVNNTFTDQAIVQSFGDVRSHNVFTTELDEIINQNDSKRMKEVKSLEHEYSSFIRQMVQLFTKRFRFAKKDYWKGAREEGELDARNLWKLPTRTGDDYFEENNPKFINKMAASILVDISGSQDKEESEYGKLLQVLTLAFSKGLSASHIKHEILGYHAPISQEMRDAGASEFYSRRSNKLQTVIYKTFNQKDCFGIGNMEISCSDNSDGESVRIAVKRLLKERAKSRVLFIVTDGKPYLSDSDIAVLDEDLKTALREAVSQKVQVFAFGFAPNGTTFYGDRFCYIQNLTDVVKFCNKMAVN